MVQPTLQMFFL